MKIITSNVINVGDKRRQINHFDDGGGRNDHTLLIRGDMLFIYTVDAPYNNRLHPLRAVVATAMVALVRICYFIVHSHQKSTT